MRHDYADHEYKHQTKYSHPTQHYRQFDCHLTPTLHGYLVYANAYLVTYDIYKYIDLSLVTNSRNYLYLSSSNLSLKSFLIHSS